MTVGFIEAGGDATGGLDFYASSSGTVSVDSSIKNSGRSSLKFDSSGFSQPSYVVTAAGSVSTLTTTTSVGRASVWLYVQNFPASSASIISIESAPSTNIFFLGLTSAGVLLISDGVGTTLSTGTAVCPTAAWFRVCLAWSISSLSVNSFAVYFNGSAIGQPAANNVTMAAGGWPANAGRARFGWISAPGGSRVIYVDDVYIDDTGGAIDVGSVRVTAKLPASLNTNSFSTLGGSGTNRWDRVAERPVTVGNYIAHLSGTDVQENFGLQGVTAGDADTTGATYLARTAWIWAKKGSPTSTDPTATGSGQANAIGTTIATSAMNVSAGDIVVVAVADQMGGAAPTLTDSVGGNTWTALSGPTTNTIRASKWYSIITNGGASMTVTATFASATASRAIVAAAWSSSLFSASPLDTNVVNANDSTTPFTCPSTGTLAQANEIVLAFNFAAGATVVTATSPNLLAIAVASNSGSAATNASAAIGYQVVAATTAVAPVFAGTSRTSVQGAGSLKYNTSGVKSAAGTPKLMDNGSESAVTLSTTAGIFSLLTTASSYPSNAAGIGMRSSGAGAVDTYFYEGGTMIAYIPAPIAKPLALSQAVKRAAFY
jgi:hypothetical protein